MWGYDEAQPRVLVENKFWAGLTENQPVSYLETLAKYPQPTVLLVVAPEARVETLWRELKGRLKAAEISASDGTPVASIVYSLTTDIGPILALTSWTRVVFALEQEAANEPSALSDAATHASGPVDQHVRGSRASSRPHRP